MFLIDASYQNKPNSGDTKGTSGGGQAGQGGGKKKGKSR